MKQKMSDATKLSCLMMFTYMVSYITRINYGAVISDMVVKENMLKSTLSLAVTGSFITYGIGQLISGYMGDKYEPKKLVFWGLLVTSVMNLLIPLCSSPLQMLFVWCINGLAQSFMWPPIVKIMTAKMNDREYQEGAVIVSWGSSFGTILIYLLAPLVIKLSGWRSVFFLSSLCGILMLIIWHFKCPEVKESKNITKPTIQIEDSSFNMFSPLMIGIMVAIVMQGILRDGVTTWMPSYISETYKSGTEISILTGVILPVFSIASYKVTHSVYAKTVKNPMLLAGMIFALGIVSAAFLLLVTGKFAGLSVLLSAVLIGAMHGVNFMLIGIVPLSFKKYGNVSFASGLLNCCTYVGSAVSTYGIAKISELTNWNVILILWTLVASIGTLVCFMSVKSWKKKFM